MPTTLGTDRLALAHRLRPVLLKLSRHLRREVHPLGVSGGQVTLLIQIKKQPGIGVRELARREAVSTAAMSKALDRLERAGLVTRAPGTDRRRVGLAVTEEGDRVLRAVRSRRTAWLAARLKLLSEEDAEALDAAVEPLLRLLETAE